MSVRRKTPNKANCNQPKSFDAKELTYDEFGILYAKRTQFRVVEYRTLEDWRWRKPARRQAPPLGLGQRKMPGNRTLRYGRMLPGAQEDRVAGDALLRN